MIGTTVEVEPVNAEPKVSVVMCAKNEEKYIGVAIESILHQTYPNVELVVIDDGCSDGTPEIVRAFNDPRVRLYANNSGPHGAAAGRNLGVKLSTGTLVALQDADDYSYPNRIELQVRAQAIGHKPRVVGSWIEERLGERVRVRRLPTSHGDIVAGFHRFCNRVTFVSGTMLFPRSVWLAVPERPQFQYMEDWDQLCRIAEADAVEFCNVPEPLFVYNIRPKGVKGKSAWPLFRKGLSGTPSCWFG
jgi:glycosyltransferase involved in cell wall biosynthesis